MYLISKRHRFIFIHNPKSGGTSVFQALRPYSDLMCRVPENAHIVSRILLRANFACSVFRPHATAAEMYRSTSEHRWNQFFRFGFVRHPAHRLWSYYQYVLSRPQHQQNRSFRSFPDFRTFLNHLNQPGGPSVPEQWRYFYDPDGRRQLVSYIGKLETIKTDFHHICQNIGIAPFPIGHLNRQPNPGQSSGLTSDRSIWQKIHHLFQQDYTYFQYPIFPD